MRRPKYQLKSRKTIPCFFAFSCDKGSPFLWSELKVLKKGVFHFLSNLKFGIQLIKKGIKNGKIPTLNFMDRKHKRAES